MPRPDLIRERDRVDEERKKAKKKWDEQIRFSSKDKDGKERFTSKPSVVVSEDGYHRLLDEGAVTYDDGSLRSIIKKGVVKNWYDNLADDYIGTFNQNHQEFEIIGDWSKSDLRLVDIGNGRYAVDIKVVANLDLEDAWVKRQKKNVEKYGTDFGISAEFYGELDEELSFTEKYDYCPIFDTIDLRDVGIVHTVGNVNSRGLKFDNNKDEVLNLEWLNNMREKYAKKETKVELKDVGPGNITEEDIRNFLANAETLQNEVETLRELLEAADAKNEELEAQLKETSEAVNEQKEENETLVEQFKSFGSLTAETLRNAKIKKDAPQVIKLSGDGADLWGGL